MYIKGNTHLAQICHSIRHLKSSIDTVSLPDHTQSKPIIGISTNHDGVDENKLTDTYIESVVRAGGIPLVIPYCESTELLVEAVSSCHGLILTGGGDLHPLWLEESAAPISSQSARAVSHVRSEKDLFDLTLLAAAARANIPTLGICRGMQLMAIFFGGALIQDIPSEVKPCLDHVQRASRYELWHHVQIHPTGRLREIIGGADRLAVNSCHHQAVKTPPHCATLCAHAPDGITEGMDLYPEHNMLAVQWHPEALAAQGHEEHLRLFEHLVQEARLHRRATFAHSHMITIDSHCDTPMTFSTRGGQTDFSLRSDVALVDLPKMRDGGLDAVFMVAYLPQGPCDEEGHRKAFEAANSLLDQMDGMLTNCTDDVLFADKHTDLHALKRAGKKAIFKGIENGYALGTDLSHIAHFAARGVQYITLSHNGDNAICDSASKSSRTHGGLSDFGREVIREMNRLGLIVDLSHTADSTVRDVLDLSSKPVIASHSSCRTVYNHPRNLPDDLIRAISAHGGVVQMCMYGGFLREKASEATLLDYADHLCHAVELVGVEHVGIGTDFDGDGEVIGCRSAADLKRLTVELLRRGFSEKELSLIWGGNLLRVLHAQ